jgi:hypothetical protein
MEGKAKGIVSATANRSEIDLQNLSSGLHKENGIRKALERLGRLKEKYKRVSSRVYPNVAFLMQHWGIV